MDNPGQYRAIPIDEYDGARERDDVIKYIEKLRKFNEKRANPKYGFTKTNFKGVKENELF